MTRNLSTDEFKWLPPDKIKKIDVNTIQKDNTYGCTSEIDLDYLEELHTIYTMMILYSS